MFDEHVRVWQWYERYRMLSLCAGVIQSYLYTLERIDKSPVMAGAEAYKAIDRAKAELRALGYHWHWDEP